MARLGWVGATRAFLSIGERPAWSLWGAILILALAACSGLTLEEQKTQIQTGKIHFDGLTVQAFLETWGRPVYTHRERMQFYTLDNGNSLPRFRVPSGEVPEGWGTGIISEDAIFFGYPDRGEMLGFVEGRLVYREQVSADEMHKLAKAWAHEDRFKTRLEQSLPSSSVK